MDEESYEEFEERITQRAAERAVDILEERFKQRAKRFVVRQILSGGWKVVASIGAWEFTKALGLPHWIKELIVGIVGG